MITDDYQTKISKREMVKTRLVEIDALRALACLAVYVFHVGAMAGFDKRVLPTFSIGGFSFREFPNFLSLGASGVSLFFVLSGFILFLRYKHFNPPPVSIYYWNRFFRIVPAYWAAIVFSLVSNVLRGADAPVLADPLSHLFFLHGFFVDYFLSLNGAFWSMATEAQFYLIFPALLFTLKFVSVRVMVISLVTFSVLLRFAIEHGDFISVQKELQPLFIYQLPGRISDFVLGMLLADLFRAKTMPRTSVLMCISVASFLLALWCRLRRVDFIVDVLMGVVSFGGIGALLNLQIQWKRTTSLILQFFGKVSYCFFLTHLPTCYLFLFYFPVDMDYSPWMNFAWIVFSTFPLCLAIGALLCFCLEEPLYNRTRRVYDQ